MINKELAKKRGIVQEDIAEIEVLHQVRYNLLETICRMVSSGEEYRSSVYFLGQTLFRVEKTLQELWKFDDNINYYRFWEVPCCSCPKDDNQDRFPHGYYVVSQDCWLHFKKGGS